jgi:hypothetical protein
MTTRKQETDKKQNDAKGLLSEQLQKLAPGQKYDTETGNVSAGGERPGRLGKGALEKAILNLGQTPCVTRPAAAAQGRKPAASAQQRKASRKPEPESPPEPPPVDVAVSINDVSEERLRRALRYDKGRNHSASRDKNAPLVSNLLAERNQRPFADLQDCINRVTSLGTEKQRRLAAADIFFPTPQEPTKKIDKPRQVNKRAEWTEEEDAILKDAIARLGEHGHFLSTLLVGPRSHTDGAVRVSGTR